ncbi:MAG: hypothetical protein KDK36_11795 [Leptospiraceae bacterium]|nr:hypothetical protein [Leptospiraceae bacterium]
MKKGDKAKLIKKTFMQDGIFILTGSIVEIAEVHEEGINVIYNDKEGYPHILKNLQKEDLSEI